MYLFPERREEKKLLKIPRLADQRRQQRPKRSIAEEEEQKGKFRP
jgi:hypothetical protein